MRWNAHQAVNLVPVQGDVDWGDVVFERQMPGIPIITRAGLTGDQVHLEAHSVQFGEVCAANSGCTWRVTRRRWVPENLLFFVDRVVEYVFSSPSSPISTNTVSRGRSSICSARASKMESSTSSWHDTPNVIEGRWIGRPALHSIIQRTMILNLSGKLFVHGSY